jgi:hypothetical protein
LQPPAKIQPSIGARKLALYVERVLKVLDLSNERLDRLLERGMRIGARRDGGDVSG